MQKIPSAPLIRWKSRFWSEGSSAIISRELVLALDTLGYSVAAHNLRPSQIDGQLVDDPARRDRLRTLDQRAQDYPATHVVRCAASDTDDSQLIEGVWDIQPPAAEHVTFLTLPYGYLPSTAQATTDSRLLSQIWGCSQHVADTLVAAGFAPEKVRRVPLGYAPDVFNPHVEPTKLSTSRRFRFMSSSVSSGSIYHYVGQCNKIAK